MWVIEATPEKSKEHPNLRILPFPKKWYCRFHFTALGLSRDKIWREKLFLGLVLSFGKNATLLAGVIFEKYILVFQIQIFGSKYKIQEGLKPDRNNAREGRIVGRDAEGAWRGLCAAYPPLPRGATAAWRPDRLQCRSRRWCYPGRRLCAHSGTPVLVPHTDTWPLSPPDEDQNASDRRLPLV